MKLVLTVAFLTLCSWQSFTAQAEPVTFTSSDSRVNILELYTSEGCSSCPPADKWLSQYQTDARLWKEFIPVAFHVDYWNYIGWPDRYASPDYGNRQREYAKGRNISAVYTPGIMLNGQEWRAWFYKRPLDLDKSANAGKLRVDLTDNQFTAFFKTDNDEANSVYLNIAILGFDLITKVKAGENKGKELEHDFVVLGYNRVPMKKMENGYSVSANLPKLIESATKKGLAAWIDYDKDLTPIQATGGWLASK